MKPYHLAGDGSDTVLHNKVKSTRLRRLFLRPVRAAQEGFTRAELLASVVALLVVVGVVLPLAGNTKARGDQAGCVNNLRRIGQAFHLWGNDHGDRNPIRVWQADGGLLPIGSANAWMGFYFLRQELGAPEVLACPGDTKLVAQDFSNSPTGGFVNINYRDRAVSYTFGLHAVPDEPFSILSSDRNLRVDSGPIGCSIGVDNAWAIRYTSSLVQWTDSVHYPGGNVLFNSGAVEQLSTEGLRRAIQIHTNSTFNTLHVLIP